MSGHITNTMNWKGEAAIFGGVNAALMLFASLILSLVTRKRKAEIAADKRGEARFENRPDEQKTDIMAWLAIGFGGLSLVLDMGWAVDISTGDKNDDPNDKWIYKAIIATTVMTGILFIYSAINGLSKNHFAGYSTIIM